MIRRPAQCVRSTTSLRSRNSITASTGRAGCSATNAASACARSSARGAADSVGEFEHRGNAEMAALARNLGRGLAVLGAREAFDATGKQQTAQRFETARGG